MQICGRSSNVCACMSPLRLSTDLPTCNSIYLSCHPSLHPSALEVHPDHSRGVGWVSGAVAQPGNVLIHLQHGAAITPGNLRCLYHGRTCSHACGVQPTLGIVLVVVYSQTSRVDLQALIPPSPPDAFQAPTLTCNGCSASLATCMNRLPCKA